MNRMTATRWAASVLTVSAVLVVAAGCRDEAKEQPAATNTGGVGKQSPKSQDPAEAEIQAERAKLSPEDRQLVDAQEWCVSSDERLGSMGAPIKLTVKDQPVFICCGGCRRKALADPDATLAKVLELKKKKQAESSGK